MPRTFKHLYPQICTWENLYEAWRKARKGKRGRPPAATFEFNLEDNLCRLEQELVDKTYRPGAYASFYIHEPKRRLISAAKIASRILVVRVIFTRSSGVRKTLSTKVWGIVLAPETIRPAPMFWWPTSLFFNGERIDLIPMPGSHDDNEIMVHFPVRMDDGSTRIALVVSDNIYISREVLDEAKRQVTEATGETLDLQAEVGLRGAAVTVSASSGPFVGEGWPFTIRLQTGEATLDASGRAVACVSAAIS